MFSWWSLICSDWHGVPTSFLSHESPWCPVIPPKYETRHDIDNIVFHTIFIQLPTLHLLPHLLCSNKMKAAFVFESDLCRCVHWVERIPAGRHILTWSLTFTRRRVVLVIPGIKFQHVMIVSLNIWLPKHPQYLLTYPVSQYVPDNLALGHHF